MEAPKDHQWTRLNLMQITPTKRMKTPPIVKTQLEHEQVETNNQFMQIVKGLSISIENIKQISHQLAKRSSMNLRTRRWLVRPLIERKSIKT